jgi:signal transduction histidine kinase
VQSTNNSQISLIDDLLNASRIERGKMEFFFEKADLAELARITYDQLLPQAKMRKIELIYNVPTEALPAVMMDKEKVRQVINNMVDNAIKYTKQGSVTMSIEKTPTDLVMKVKDTGRGVDPKIAPTLFSKYTRGKDAATAATGLGLGLYVAKVIIEQNHGRIWVESEGEGKEDFEHAQDKVNHAIRTMIVNRDLVVTWLAEVFLFEFHFFVHGQNLISDSRKAQRVLP